MTKPNVLVVAVDTENDFVRADGLLAVAGAEALIEPMRDYVAALDRTEVAAFLATFDLHDAATYFGSPENLGDPANDIPGFPLHCEVGTAGAENVLDLDIPVRNGIPTYRLEKGVFDMWQEDDVRVSGEPREAFFSRLRREGVDTARLFGVAADFCVMWAIRGFLERGFRVEVVGRLTAGIARDMARTVADEFPGRVALVS